MLCVIWCRLHARGRACLSGSMQRLHPPSDPCSFPLRSNTSDQAVSSYRSQTLAKGRELQWLLTPPEETIAQCANTKHHASCCLFWFENHLILLYRIAQLYLFSSEKQLYIKQWVDRRNWDRIQRNGEKGQKHFPIKYTMMCTFKQSKHKKNGSVGSFSQEMWCGATFLLLVTPMLWPPSNKASVSSNIASTSTTAVCISHSMEFLLLIHGVLHSPLQINKENYTCK